MFLSIYVYVYLFFHFYLYMYMYIYFFFYDHFTINGNTFLVDFCIFHYNQNLPFLSGASGGKKTEETISF